MELKTHLDATLHQKRRKASDTKPVNGRKRRDTTGPVATSKVKTVEFDIFQPPTQYPNPVSRRRNRALWGGRVCS